MPSSQVPQPKYSVKESREKPGDEAQEAQQFKDSVMQLKNKRDADINELIRQRNAKIQSLMDQFKTLSQKGAAKIQQEKNFIQLQASQGKDVSKAKAVLMQEEQALMKESMAVQQQVNTIKAAYDQQIQKLSQAYAQQFAVMQQQMTTER
jgi:hypothetical protein